MNFLKTKKGKIIAACGVVLAVLAVLLIVFLNTEKGYRSISVTEISGRVMTENGGNVYAAYENMRIGGGFVLSTDAESYTRMLLDEDKYVRLEQLSRASFEELGDSKRRNTVIHIEEGTIVTEITAPLEKDESYVITTPNSIMAVRGTHFRVSVKKDANGDFYTDVYTYGGVVACSRIMPNGMVANEEVLVRSGYKARVKMDEIVTVYVEEIIGAQDDDVDPLFVEEVPDNDLVDIYNAAVHGRSIFESVENLWGEIIKRDVDISKYRSQYDGAVIKPYEDDCATDDESSAPGEETSADGSTSTDAEHSDAASESTEITDEATSSAAPSDSDSSDEYGGEAGESSSDEKDVTTPVITEQSSIEEITAAESTTEESTTEESTTEESATEESATEESTTEESTESTTEASEETKATTTGTTVPETTEPPVTDLGVAVNGTNFPDEIFRNYISANIDADSDGYLSDTEIGAVTELDVSGTDSADGGVESLEGVEHFTELTTLRCYYNENLTDIDVSANTALTNLDCSDTAITQLNVSANTALTNLFCQNCALAFLDISNNTSLTTFNASGNKYVIPSNVTAFDASAISGFDPMKVSGVNNADFDTATGVFSNIADDVSYIYDCGQGSSATFTLARTGAQAVAAVDSTSFPDEAFRNYIGANFDTDGDGYLSTEEAAAVKGIDISGRAAADGGVVSLEGIEYFTELTALKCYYNQNLTEIDVSGNTALVTLQCYNTGLTSLDISGNTALVRLDCFDTGITALDLSNNKALTSLNCRDTAITALDVRENTALTTLDCSSTRITALDVSQNTALTLLSCLQTNITSLEIDKNTALETLYCSNTAITSLDVSQNTALTLLVCSSTGITSLATGNNTALETLYCDDTGITSLDLSMNTALVTLNCSNTGITVLDVSCNTALENLYCSNTGVASLDLSGNTALKKLNCGSTDISSLDVSGNTALELLECAMSALAYVDVSGNTSLTSFNADGNEYIIPSGADTFDASAINGFDSTKVSDVTNADFDAATGIFSNITGDVTYTYDCGQGYSVRFRLVLS